MNVTVKKSKAWTFVCPGCDWPGVAWTEEAVHWLAKYHIRTVHGETAEVTTDSATLAGPAHKQGDQDA